MNSMNARNAVINEAISWLLTPFHHEARIKGAGVDCGMFIADVFEKTGLIPHEKIDHYPRDFMLHRDEEWYLALVEKYFNKTELPLLPGDLILTKNGRLYSHGMIVIEYPVIIHASAPDKKVLYADVSKTPLSAKPLKYFRLKQWCDE